MGYSKFGKIIRKRMIDREENLSDLATLLKVSVPFVSAVLTGKKAVPDQWVEILAEHYEISGDEYYSFCEAFCEGKKTVKFDVSSLSTQKKRIAVQLQRKLPDLEDEELQQILEILGDD